MNKKNVNDYCYNFETWKLLVLMFEFKSCGDILCKNLENIVLKETT